MGAFGAGLAQGLGSGVKEAIERRDRKEYQDALIMQAKAHAQLFEAQHILAKQKGEAQTQLGEVLKTIPGFGGPQPSVQGQPGMAPQSGMAQGQPQLGPQPYTGQPQMGAQPSSGQIPMLTPQQAFAFDALAKQAYDLNTDMLKQAMSRKDYSYKVDTGSEIQVYNKAGEMIQKIPKAMEFDYQPTQPTPGGPTYVIPIPKRYPPPGGGAAVGQPGQPGGMAGVGPPTLVKEPAGSNMTMDKAGKLNLVGASNDRMSEVNELLFPGGKVDRELLLKAQAPGGGLGQGAVYNSKLQQIFEMAIRMETGATANQEEIKNMWVKYGPKPWDTDEAVKSKLNDLTQYVRGAQKIADPTGTYMKQRQTTQLRTVNQLPDPKTLKEGQTATEQSTGNKLQVIGGQWVVIQRGTK